MISRLTFSPTSDRSEKPLQTSDILDFTLAKGEI
jgi:hypothetical protein